MNFVTTNDMARMTDDDAWNSYLSEKIDHIKPDRNTSIEWPKIKERVKDVDGPTTPGSHMYRHYVPYQAIRNSLEERVMGLTLLQACEQLQDIIKTLYSEKLQVNHGNPTFSITDLRPPLNALAKDSLRVTLETRKRFSMVTWINWALEAICDFPDNIYYGPGSGDKNGTVCDIPTGLNKDRQLSRVKNGADLLHAVIGVVV
jgi:hypothetical protein